MQKPNKKFKFCLFLSAQGKDSTPTAWPSNWEAAVSTSSVLQAAVIQA